MDIFGLGTPELLLILGVILLLFGKDKLPELARSIGKSFRELKSGFEKSSDPLELAKNGAKEPSLDEKAKEVERQRSHLQQLEGELDTMKKGPSGVSVKQKT